jgi:hypothetical protein
MTQFCCGSWPRDNATEGVSDGVDRSVAAQHGCFDHFFPISVWRQPWCVPRASGRRATRAGLSQAPIAAISGLTPMMFNTRVRLTTTARRALIVAD